MLKPKKQYTVPLAIFNDVVDSIADLCHFLEQIEVLAQDLIYNYFERVTIDQERGLFIEEYDLYAAQVKAELMHTQTAYALEKAHELRASSYEAAETAREGSKC